MFWAICCPFIVAVCDSAEEADRVDVQGKLTFEEVVSIHKRLCERMCIVRVIVTL